MNKHDKYRRTAEVDWSNSGYLIRHKWEIRDVLYPNKKFYVFFCFTSKSAATIMSVFSSHNKAWTSGNQNFAHILLPFTDSKNSKWVWSGNTTITNRRQPRGTAWKSLSTITRHQEDKLSKATSSLSTPSKPSWMNQRNGGEWP